MFCHQRMTFLPVRAVGFGICPRVLRPTSPNTDLGGSDGGAGISVVPATNMRDLNEASGC